GLPDGDPAQLHGGQILQRSAELAKGGAGTTQYHRFRHRLSPPYMLRENLIERSLGFRAKRKRFPFSISFEYSFDNRVISGIHPRSRQAGNPICKANGATPGGAFFSETRTGADGPLLSQDPIFYL